MQEPFWKTKSLSEMSHEEWESLCDGCGKCCLHKLEDDESGRIHLTVVACQLLDVHSCRCGDYARRSEIVPDCERVAPDNVERLALPKSCAYRCVAEQRALPDWHPLRTGDARSVHAAGQSVRGWALSEREVAEGELEDYIIFPWEEHGQEL